MVSIARSSLFILGLYLLCTEAMAEILYLDIVMNGKPVSDPVRIEREGDSLWVEVVDVQNSGIPMPDSFDSDRIDLCALEKVSCHYDSAKQLLRLDAAPSLLPRQSLRQTRTDVPSIAYNNGALMNYDLYASGTRHNQLALQLVHQLRGFGAWGVMETTGMFQDALDDSDSGYIRYDTYWQREDPASMHYYRAGDFVSGVSRWSRQVRLGGFQIARAFRLQPDFISYPYPEFTGSAVLPSEVDLYINNVRQFSGSVAAGPFDIDARPAINGLGTASIITTDLQGNQVRRDVDLYVATELLRPGLFDYDFSVGFLREAFGIDSLRYGDDPLAAGGLRYGLNDSVTLEGRVEGGGNVFNLGGGIDWKSGNRGVWSATLAHGRDSDVSGWQGSMGYRFNSRRFGFAARHKEQGKGYRDLGSLDVLPSVRRETQLNTSYALPGNASLGGGFFRVDDFDGSRRSLLSAFYTRSFRDFSLSASANINPEDHDDYSVGLNLHIPFGKRNSLRLRQVRDSEGNRQTVASVSHSRPLEGGLSWSVSSVLEQNTANASADWRGKKFQAGVGVATRDNEQYYRGNLSGAMVYMDEQLLFGNRVADAFALVSTPDLSNVPVLFENQLVGNTDDNGKLLVTGLSSYNPIRIAVDAGTLPLNVSLKAEQKEVMAASLHGVKVDFDIQPLRGAVVVLVDSEGQFLKVGLPVRSLSGGKDAFVGWDGRTYLEALQAVNRIEVGEGDTRCRAEFRFEYQPDTLRTIGPIICQ